MAEGDQSINTPRDGDKGKVDKELQSLERQLTIATNWRKLLDQLLPKGETKPLEGKIDTDEKFGYASELVAYQAVNRLAADVVARLLSLDNGSIIKNARVLVVDKLEPATDDPQILELESLLDSLQQGINAQRKDNASLLDAAEKSAQDEVFLIPALAALTAAPAVISALTDVASFFRTNYKFVGQDFDVKTEGLVAAVVGKLRTKGVDVVIPNFYLIDESGVLDSYKQLREGALELAKEKERLQAAKERAESNPQLKDGLSAAIQASDILTKAVEAFSETMTAQADGQQSRLAQSVVRQKIRGSGDKKVTHLLWLGNLSSGGEAITKDRLILSDQMSFVGGAVVAFAFATRQGQILAADTLVRLGALPSELPDFFGDDDEGVSYIIKPENIERGADTQYTGDWNTETHDTD